MIRIYDSNSFYLVYKWKIPVRNSQVKQTLYTPSSVEYWVYDEKHKTLFFSKHQIIMQDSEDVQETSVVNIRNCDVCSYSRLPIIRVGWEIYFLG
jgi:hypothetical protein